MKRSSFFFALSVGSSLNEAGASLKAFQDEHKAFSSAEAIVAVAAAAAAAAAAATTAEALLLF